MNFLSKYNRNIVKYDFINKFNYSFTNNIPKILSITLSFDFKRFNMKLLISALASLQIITFNKGKVTKSNVLLKLRNGHPVGCKITLHKNLIYKFLFNILNKLIINLKIKKNKTNNSFSIQIKNMLIFENLEKNYQFFKNLPHLNVSIKTTDCTFNEFIFLLNSFKIKLK